MSAESGEKRAIPVANVLEHPEGSAQAPARQLWTVRYTWKVVNGGLPHPEHTFAHRESESRAVDAAVYALDNADTRGTLRLLAVHIKAPGSDVWRKLDE